jgi:carboxyl-terminal processing protease
MIIPSLLKERLFFDFATDYRFSHDTILYDFEFSDTDFLDFTNYISDKDYTYETATEKSLKKLKKKAEDEEYFDALSEEYDALVLKMELNKEDDLQNSKGDIKEILTGEIMSRYYYQKGRLKAGLNFDIELDKAIEILQNKEQYNKILGNE